MGIPLLPPSRVGTGCAPKAVGSAGGGTAPRTPTSVPSGGLRGGRETPCLPLPHRYALAQLAAPGASGCARLAPPAAPRAGQPGRAAGSSRASLPLFPHLVMVSCWVLRLGGSGHSGVIQTHQHGGEVPSAAPSPPKSSLGPSWGCRGARGDPLSSRLGGGQELSTPQRCRGLPARPSRLWASFCREVLRHPWGQTKLPRSTARGAEPPASAGTFLSPSLSQGSPPFLCPGVWLLAGVPPVIPASSSWGFGAPASPQARRPGLASLGAGLATVNERGRGFAGSRIRPLSPPSRPPPRKGLSLGRALGQAGVTLTPWVATETPARLCGWQDTGWGAWGHGVMAGGGPQWKPGKGGVPHLSVSYGAGLRPGNSSHPSELVLHWRGSKRCLGLAP